MHPLQISSWSYRYLGFQQQLYANTGCYFLRPVKQSHSSCLPRYTRHTELDIQFWRFLSTLSGMLRLQSTSRFLHWLFGCANGSVGGCEPTDLKIPWSLENHIYWTLSGRSTRDTCCCRPGNSIPWQIGHLLQLWFSASWKFGVCLTF
jgi:hypothetical protein